MSELLQKEIISKLDILINHLGAGKQVIGFDPALVGGDKSVVNIVNEDVIIHGDNSVTDFHGKPVETETDPYAGVDADGVVWDARIHSKAKEPKSTTTGKWKRRKGIKDELYDEVLAELKERNSQMDEVLTADLPSSVNGPFFWKDSVTGVSNTCDDADEFAKILAIPTSVELTREEFDALLEDVPAAPIAVPKAPKAPKAPGVPTATGAAVVTGAASVKPDVLMLIKELTVDLSAESNDIDQLMAETFDGVDTIAKLTEAQLIEFQPLLEQWIADIMACTNAEVKMRAIAGEVHKASLDEGIQSILGPHAADCFGLVHYSAIEGVLGQMTEYLKSWEAM